MKTASNSNVRPYYPISRYYREVFGERVHKISVNVAYTCPHRRSDGSGGCIFCDEYGAAADPAASNRPLSEQIESGRERLSQRSGVRKFLVYFQAFTHTLSRIATLEHHLSVASQMDGICGIVLGTRPDCLPEPVIDLFKVYAERLFFSVELGVQSFFDHQLRFLNRGHSAAQSIEAIRHLHDGTGIHTGLHLIMGLPGETDAEIIETAAIVNRLTVGAVKLHQLHVLKNTALETRYRQGQFQPLDLAEYSRRVILFLEHLSPSIPVQRLAAYSSRAETLVAPSWTGDRLGPSRSIETRMAAESTYQGRCCPSPSI
jgi:uncharacterized protein